MLHGGKDPTTAIITPSDFQEICDQAALAVDLQGWNANAEPYELAAVITEVHKGICRQLRENYREKKVAATERGKD